MCGLAGVFNLTRVDCALGQDVTHRMKESLAHRGPDEGVTWESVEHGLHLIFTRLKIQDLSAAGRQPMMDNDQSVIICFNGEIYNYQLVRAELMKRGYTFTSTGDTQVILAAYKEWGIDFLYKLDGIFAIALYDMTRRELFLIRDRIGVKPLYLSFAGGVVSFASEIKALWHLPWMSKEISPIALYHYLTFMVTPAPYTLYQNIYKLPAGSYVKIDQHKRVTWTEWYTPVTVLSDDDRAAFHDEQFCLENISTLLVEAVRKRMISDVPIGAFLSGGIDSSLNVALMARFSHQLKTFTIAFQEQGVEHELTWARMVAHQFGTEHHELIISEKEAFDFYEKMVYQLDEPLADCVCIPFYYVAALARQHGVPVVQIGEGADELFIGYHLYAQYKKLHDYFWDPIGKYVPRFMRQGCASLARPFIKNSFHADILHRWVTGGPLFWGGAVGFSELEKRSLMAHLAASGFQEGYDSAVELLAPGLPQRFDSSVIINYHLEKLHHLYPGADFFQQLLYIELKQRLPELLLMRADKMSMAVGVEAREPFLDYKLVEFLMHVPESVKCQGGIKKYLLKKIAQGVLPDMIINRQKVGFAAPTMAWFERGSYFPAYFKSLEQQQHLVDRWMPATKMIESTNKKIEPRAAVQRWIIQNAWAVR